MDLALSRRRVLKGLTTAGVSTMAGTGAVRATSSSETTGNEAIIQNPAITWETTFDGEIEVTHATENLFVTAGNQPAVAIDPTDGTEVWQADVGHGRHVLGEENLCVGGQLGAEAVVDGIHGISRSTGQIVWQRDLNASPVLVGGDVALFVEGDGYANSGNILGIDTVSGETLWDSAAEVGLRDFNTPDGEDVYIGDMEGGIRAISLSDGSEQWVYETQVPSTWVTPNAFNESSVFVGSHWGTVLKLDRETGEEYWRNEVGDASVEGAPGTYRIYLADRLYVLSHSPVKVEAVDPESGETLWTNSLDTSPINAAVVNGRLYLVRGGRVEAIDVNDGSPIWDAEIGGREVTVADRQVLVGGSDQLHSLDTETGDEYWSIETPADVSSAPVVRDDTIVGTSEGYSESSVFAVSETPSSTGEQGWTDGQLRALVGLGFTGLIGGLAWFSRRSQSGEDEPDGSSNEDSTLTVDDMLNTAGEAVELAEDVAAEGDYEAALKHYETAVDKYQTALERTSNEEITEDTEAMLSDIRDKQANIRGQIEARSKVGRQLKAAEESLNEAVIAHVENRSTLAGIRYRQARESYTEAIDSVEESEYDVFETPLSISFEAGENIPDSLDEISWLDNEAKEYLSNVGIQTFSDFRKTDLEEISSEDVITDDPDIRLRALFWLTPLDGIVFADPDEIRKRQDLVQLGFDAV